MTSKLSLLALTLLLSSPLALQAQITAESENNNTESAADGPLTSGVKVTGSIGSTSDVDWYKFNVGGSGTVSVSLNHTTGRDFDVFLYRSTGSYVASGQTSNRPETCSYISATTPEVYYVKVTRFSGTGAYDLTVTFPTGSSPTPTPTATPTPTPTATATPTPTPTPTPTGGFGPRPTKPTNQTSWITGNAADSSKQPVNGPGILLMGGNFDVDEAFLNRAYPVANGGDVVVLRSSGTNGYNDYLFNLTTGTLKPDSVETIVVDTVTKANSAYVEWVLQTAEFVYIAGGDQADYLNFWDNTKVETAIEAAYARGAVIGGISAGCAVMGENIYDPDGVSGIYSSEAASNPCHPNMIVSTGFLDFPLTANMITDTHFAQRNRMGRLMAFMAYIVNPSLPPTDTVVRGVGVDEDTCLFINKDGIGTVDGDFAAYILNRTGSTGYNQVSCGSALNITNMSRTKLTAGQTYNFNTGATTGTTTNISINGSSCTYTFTQEANCFYSPVNVY